MPTANSTSASDEFTDSATGLEDVFVIGWKVVSSSIDWSLVGNDTVISVKVDVIKSDCVVVSSVENQKVMFYLNLKYIYKWS